MSNAPAIISLTCCGFVWAVILIPTMAYYAGGMENLFNLMMITAIALAAIISTLGITALVIKVKHGI